MSHHFFNENEILEPEALNPELIDINSRLLDINLDNNFSMNREFYQPCYSLQPSNQFSPTQHFIYKAELTNAFLEKGTIDIVDQFEAENKAILNDFQSENAFEVDNGFNIDTEAGHRIKNSLLYESYFDKGYVDPMDMYSAEQEAYLQGPVQDLAFESIGYESTSCGESFIKDSLLTESYLENGMFSVGDVIDADLTAFSESMSIDYLF